MHFTWPRETVLRAGVFAANSYRDPPLQRAERVFVGFIIARVDRQSVIHVAGAINPVRRGSLAPSGSRNDFPYHLSGPNLCLLPRHRDHGLHTIANLRDIITPGEPVMHRQGNVLLFHEYTVHVAKTAVQFPRQKFDHATPGQCSRFDELQSPAADFHAVLAGIDNSGNTHAPAKVPHLTAAHERDKSIRAPRQRLQRHPNGRVQLHFVGVVPNGRQSTVEIQKQHQRPGPRNLLMDSRETGIKKGRAGHLNVFFAAIAMPALAPKVKKNHNLATWLLIETAALAIHNMRLTVRLTLSLIVGVTIVSLALAFYQERMQTRGLRQELDNRARVLAENVQADAARLSENQSWTELRQILERLCRHENLFGAAVYDSSGRPQVVTGDITNVPFDTPKAAREASRTAHGVGELDHAGDRLIHVYALPFNLNSDTPGILTLFADAAYIEARESDLWRRSLAGVLVQTLLIVIVTMAILKWSLHRPMTRLAEWLGELHKGETSSSLELPEEEAFRPVRREAARLATSLATARAAAEEEARLRDSSDSLWTPERLRAFVRHRLKGSRLFAISNREPYEHSRDANGAIHWDVPASGLVTALESVLRACEGTWIAQGTGDADRETSDEDGRLMVPPDHPAYTLRRIWVTPEEEAGFYLGVANEGLWPLCHIVHTRPMFNASDWNYYRTVNRRFADALLEEARHEEHPVILVQDYHFALVPAMVKDKRPDARVAIFWHIPWPNPEAFSICPWQNEVLDGLLGADLIGFHLQAHCNNFLATVDQALESRIDHDRFAVDRRGHTTLVHPFPISIAFTDSPPPAEPAFAERLRLLKELGIEASMLGIGVDRADYTKGIPERFRAIEVFLEINPKYRGHFTFVQVAAPSRIGVPRYQEVMQEIIREADRVNRRFQTQSWKPIVLLMRHHSHEEILPYYRASDLCMVTSLHDGMNLVAKEYVAARADEQGVLILSHFAGASHELNEALVVNPYDASEMAEAIRRALEMSPQQKRDRMSRMRTQIREHNIYRWAGNLVGELTSVRIHEPAIL